MIILGYYDLPHKMDIDFDRDFRFDQFLSFLTSKIGERTIKNENAQRTVHRRLVNIRRHEQKPGDTRKQNKDKTHVASLGWNYMPFLFFVRIVRFQNP
jgi:hypothetical protein